MGRLIKYQKLTLVISEPGRAVILNSLAFADKANKQKTNNVDTPKCTPIIEIYFTH